MEMAKIDEATKIKPKNEEEMIETPEMAARDKRITKISCKIHSC